MNRGHSKALCLSVIVAMCVTVTAQPPLEFEVASIRSNTTNTFVPERAGGGVAAGQFWLSNVTAGTIILRGYPLDGVPEMLNLPAWATSERYDVLAKGKRGATADEQQQMWRVLLTDRLKLQAHYETRPQRGYHLILARTDRRLGPQLQPSTLDCTQPQPSITRRDAEAIAMQRCGFLMVGTAGGPTAVSGSTTVAAIARFLSGVVEQSVIDRTGLEGNYAVKIHYAQQPSLTTGTTPLLPGDVAPSIFVAVQEQLGLKLEAATVNVKVLVVDSIERPSEN